MIHRAFNGTSAATMTIEAHPYAASASQKSCPPEKPPSDFPRSKTSRVTACDDCAPVTRGDGRPRCRCRNRFIDGHGRALRANFPAQLCTAISRRWSTAASRGGLDASECAGRRHGRRLVHPARLHHRRRAGAPLRAAPRKPCISMGRLRPAAQPTSSHASLRRNSRRMGASMIVEKSVRCDGLDRCRIRRQG